MTYVEREHNPGVEERGVKLKSEQAPHQLKPIGLVPEAAIGKGMPLRPPPFNPAQVQDWMLRAVKPGNPESLVAKRPKRCEICLGDCDDSLVPCLAKNQRIP